MATWTSGANERKGGVHRPTKTDSRCGLALACTRITAWKAKWQVSSMPPSEFGRRLREARRLRGWTQDRLAKESDIPAAVISHFETGTRQRASAANLVKLARALSVSVDYLLGRTGAIDIRDHRVQATFRRLSGASAETIDQAVRVIDALLDRETEERE